MAATLLLDRTIWDLVLDVRGSIAVASEPYALAQDAASAIKLFQGELFYDTAKGVPYWASVLGKAPPLSLIKSKLVSAALTVPGVVAARAYVSSFANRVVSGQIQIFDQTGRILSVAGF